jgi:hypothetical protein
MYSVLSWEFLNRFDDGSREPAREHPSGIFGAKTGGAGDEVHMMLPIIQGNGSISVGAGTGRGSFCAGLPEAASFPRAITVLS